MKQKILIIAVVLFFAAMAALTLTARGVREARLPHVEVNRLTRESFADSGDDSFVIRKIAVPKAIFNADGIFIIVSRPVNGEKRDFAHKAFLEIGLELEEYYEVTKGLMGHELVIFHSDRPLKDGDEVIIVK